jgi:hypothetical protein
MKIKSAGLIAALGIVLSIQPARADVVIGTGPADLSNLCCFGTPNTTTFGELFTAPITGTLSSFTLDLVCRQSDWRDWRLERVRREQHIVHEPGHGIGAY